MAPDLQFGGVFCGNPETGRERAEQAVRVAEPKMLLRKNWNIDRKCQK